MAKRFNNFQKQKISSYFDANFPLNVVEHLITNKFWKNKCNFKSAYDFGNENRDDRFHYHFCKKNGLVLITLDNDFLNDRNYPLAKIPGIIVISSGKTNTNKIESCLVRLLDFLSFFPQPKAFIQEKKFHLSPTSCIIHGKDALTKRIKNIKLVYGTELDEVVDKFNYR